MRTIWNPTPWPMWLSEVQRAAPPEPLPVIPGVDREAGTLTLAEAARRCMADGGAPFHFDMPDEDRAALQAEADALRAKAVAEYGPVAGRLLKLDTVFR